MASSGDKTIRGNIRIEIKNDFVEEMDVDNDSKTENANTISGSECEDGEITEMKDNNEIEKTQTTRKITTGTNRNRIAVNRIDNQWTPVDGGFATGFDIFSKDEQEKLHTRAERFGLDPNETKSMTDQQLQDLHNSLGITMEDETTTRFEAVHVYGTEEMSTQDVFEYFSKYGPASIEWINDESCNVVWLDRVSAARAFHAMSNPIAGMPVSGKCDPFEETEQTGKESGRSVLLRSPEQIRDEDKENGKCVHVSHITMPVPPGYWRLGVQHPKAKFLLFRFAKRTDKKTLKAEKFSEYYRKHGNPNYDGIKGFISESKKLKMKGIETKIDRKNPWGKIARDWNKDIREQPISVPTEVIKPSKSIQERLGSTSVKRVHSDSNSDSESEKNENEEKKPRKEKSKIPRMRMYADEEEARLERLKQMKKQQIQSVATDLRNRIKTKQTQIVKPIQTRLESDYDDVDVDVYDDDLHARQKSKVTVIINARKKPTVPSTIWSRLDRERIRNRRKSESGTDASDTGSDSSDVETEKTNVMKSHVLKKMSTSRPGFRSDLKSRLNLQTEHKSPLRIEINNDHYKKSVNKNTN